MSMFMNYLKPQEQIEKDEKLCEERSIFIDTITEYDQLLNDYTIKMFYDGLDFKDYRNIEDTLEKLCKINCIYSNNELIDIERRFRNIYVALEPFVKYFNYVT